MTIIGTLEDALALAIEDVIAQSFSLRLRHVDFGRFTADRRGFYWMASYTVIHGNTAEANGEDTTKGRIQMVVAAYAEIKRLLEDPT